MAIPSEPQMRGNSSSGRCRTTGGLSRGYKNTARPRPSVRGQREREERQTLNPRRHKSHRITLLLLPLLLPHSGRGLRWKDDTTSTEPSEGRGGIQASKQASLPISVPPGLNANSCWGGIEVSYDCLGFNLKSLFF